ncbi:hypothetical protein TorRG33x02_294800, partial [Trema orientale]
SHLPSEHEEYALHYFFYPNLLSIILLLWKNMHLFQNSGTTFLPLAL